MRESNFAFHVYGEFKKSKNAFITAAYWSNPEYGASREEAAANARLIAVAPELLESLKDAHPHIADDALRTRIGNLIAKTEGGAA
jgi:hypothetical protein